MKYGICFAALCGLTLLYGCDKEDKSMGSGTSTGNPASTHIQQTKVPPEPLVVTTAEDDTVVSSKGLIIAIPAGAFADPSGAVLDDDTIEVLLHECRKNGEYISNALTTAAADHEVLSSRVAFKFTARKGSTPLTLREPLTVIVPSNDVVADDALHISEQNTNGDNTDPNTKLWIQGAAPDAFLHTPSGTYQYAIAAEADNWYQLAKTRNVGAGTVDVEVEMPFSVVVRNCVALLLMPEVGTMYLRPNERSNRFANSGYKIPKGTEVRILLIRKIDKQLSYSMQIFAIDQSKLVRLERIDDLSQEQLDNLLKTL